MLNDSPSSDDSLITNTVAKRLPWKYHHPIAVGACCHNSILYTHARAHNPKLCVKPYVTVLLRPLTFVWAKLVFTAYTETSSTSCVHRDHLHFLSSLRQLTFSVCTETSITCVHRDYSHFLYSSRLLTFLACTETTHIFSVHNNHLYKFSTTETIANGRHSLIWHTLQWIENNNKNSTYRPLSNLINFAQCEMFFKKRIKEKKKIHVSLYCSCNCFYCAYFSQK